MRRLRQSLFDTDAAFSQSWAGWQAEDATHHCSWQHVECDEQGRVTAL
jgi:hypothetical protein